MHPHEKRNRLNKLKWNLLSVIYDSFLYDIFRYMQRKVIEKMEINPKMHVLDLGCGTGRGLLIFTRLNGTAHQLSGVDISEKMIAKARKNCSNLSNVNFVVAPAEKLPFENDFFDAILCTNSFHHYSNPELALKEANRVLRTNGKIYILDLTPENKITLIANSVIQKIERQHNNFHSTAEMMTLFKNGGFEHLKSEKVIFPFRIHIGIKNPDPLKTCSAVR